MPVSHIPTWGYKTIRNKDSIFCFWEKQNGGKYVKLQKRKKQTHLWYWAWRKENSSLIRSHDSLMVNLKGWPGWGGPYNRWGRKKRNTFKSLPIKSHVMFQNFFFLSSSKKKNPHWDRVFCLMRLQGQRVQPALSGISCTPTHCTFLTPRRHTHVDCQNTYVSSFFSTIIKRKKNSFLELKREKNNIKE